MALGARTRPAQEGRQPPSAAEQLEALGVLPPQVSGPQEPPAPATAEIRLMKPALPALAAVLLILALVASVAILYYLFYALLALVIITCIWTRSLVQNVAVHRALKTEW